MKFEALLWVSYSRGFRNLSLESVNGRFDGVLKEAGTLPPLMLLKGMSGVGIIWDKCTRLKEGGQ